MKKYLIIGGAGFIGSNLSKTLLSKGSSVAIIDKIKTPLSGARQYVFDLSNTKKVFDVFSKEKPDVVFYLAGAMHLRKPVGNITTTQDMDFLLRTHTILEACKKYQVKKIVFASSGGAIYENARLVPTKESYQSHPTSLYGLANLLLEEYISAYAKSNNLGFVLPRLSNVYGPLQWQSGIVPATIIKILKGESPVLHGTGNQTRDFIYISDATDALIALANSKASGVYNIGSGKGVSLKKIVTLVGALLKKPVKIIYDKKSSSGVPKSALDITKISREFNWAPEVSLKEGLSKTIEYYKNANA